MSDPVPVPLALQFLADLPDEGFIRLTADVPNPKPDRRLKRQFPALPVWPAGTVLRVRRVVEDMSAGLKELAGRTRTRTYIRMIDPRLYGDLTMVLDHPDELDGPRILTLVAHAVDHAPSIADMMQATVFGGTAILEVLARMGRITAEDVQEAIALLDAGPEGM